MKFSINQNVTYLGQKGIITAAKYCIYSNNNQYSVKVSTENGSRKVSNIIEELIND